MLDIFNLDKWITLGERMGAGTLFGFFTMFVFAALAAYVTRRLFSKNGIVPGLVTRLETFLDNLESRGEAADKKQADQLLACQAHEKQMLPGGACNVSDIRRAAVCGLDALQEIGDAANADVTKHIEKAKAILAG